MQTPQAATFKISEQLFLSMFSRDRTSFRPIGGIPEDARILSVRFDTLTNIIVVCFESSEVEPSMDGQAIPEYQIDMENN